MKNRETSRDAQPSPDVVKTENSLTSRVLQAQDEERRKIGRELHDSVGQALVAMKMGIAKFMREHSVGEGSELDKILSTLDSTIAEVRTISHLLHPPNIDLMGLRATLAWYLDGFGLRTGIKTKFDAQEELPPLPAGAETALFRVVQECLTNIHRHAQASHVVLRMRSTGTELQLEVNDNGVGFADLDACKEGVGILGMQERLRELGGTLRVESGHGIGSSVFAEIPLCHSAAVAISPEPPPRQEPIRVVVVDDHPAMRLAIRTLLRGEPDIEVCGEAGDAAEAVQLEANLRPEIMILDLQLGNTGGGWSVIRGLRANQSSVKIVIFSQFDERYFARPAYNAGCEGAVSKSSDPNILIDAIRTIHAGGRFFPPKLVSHSA